MTTDIDDIDWENSGNWFGDACDCVERLRAEIGKLREMLLDVVVQGTICDDEAGTLDSMAISSYAEAMEYLAAHGMIEIEVSAFRRVIAKQVRR